MLLRLLNNLLSPTVSWEIISVYSERFMKRLNTVSHQKVRNVWQTQFMLKIIQNFRSCCADQFRFHSQFSSCRLCGRQCGIGNGFSPQYICFPCQRRSTKNPYSFILHSVLHFSNKFKPCLSFTIRLWINVSIKRHKYVTENNLLTRSSKMDDTIMQTLEI